MSNCQHLSNIPNIQGRLVFNDQCGRCFEDTKSKFGINVCLICFHAFCQSSSFNHTKLHYSNNNKHCLFLNIKEELIIENDNSINQNDNKNSEITKLAIGKPGGADLLGLGERFEKKLTLFCYNCSCNISTEANSLVSNTVKYIVNSSSSTESDSIKAWELEINPCEHTLTLVQENKKIISKLEAKCNNANCDINSNLWLCLTCGNLGCGRKQYDGTGGNGHGLNHYDTCLHPLSVKTGTITPQGDASVYCYACNDDVKDYYLKDHLKHLGINIEDQIKTEKNMTELNLDVNINFNLSKAVEDGKILKNLYGPGHTGIENLGNSCYMNSVLQILMSLDEFKERFLTNAKHHLNTCLKDNPNECYDCQMSKISYGMFSGDYSLKQIRKLNKVNEEGLSEEDYQVGIRPKSFKLFYNKDNSEFISNRQQDAFEYMNYFFDKLEKEESKNNNTNTAAINNLKDIFSFDVETKLQCTECHGYKIKRDRLYSLLLRIPNWKEKKEKNENCYLSECLNDWIAKELIELNCEKCNKKTNFLKNQRIKNYPSYLIVLYQRIVYEWVPFKLEINFIVDTNNVDFSVLSKDFDILENQFSLKGNEEGLTYEEIHAMNKNNKCNDTNSNNNTTKQIVNVSEDSCMQLMEFGFNAEQAKGALIKFNNNLECACNFLFEDPSFNFNEIIQNNTISNNTNKTSNKLCKFNENINKENKAEFRLRCKL